MGPLSILDLTPLRLPEALSRAVATTTGSASPPPRRLTPPLKRHQRRRTATARGMRTGPTVACQVFFGGEDNVLPAGLNGPPRSPKNPSAKLEKRLAGWLAVPQGDWAFFKKKATPWRQQQDNNHNSMRTLSAAYCLTKPFRSRKCNLPQNSSCFVVGRNLAPNPQWLLARWQTSPKTQRP